MKIPAKKAYVCLLLACNVSVSLLRADNLLTAIDKADVRQVKQLLENGYLAHSSKEYQKRVLEATDALVKGAQKAALRFIPSYDDFIHMSAGAGFFALACLDAYKIYQRKQEIILSTFNTITTGILGVASLLELYEGWTRSSARTYLAKAREIEALVAQQVDQD